MLTVIDDEYADILRAQLAASEDELIDQLEYQEEMRAVISTVIEDWN